MKGEKNWFKGGKGIKDRKVAAAEEDLIITDDFVYGNSRMSYDERSQLGQQISVLTKEQLQTVVKIVQEFYMTQDSYDPNQEILEFDLKEMPDIVC